MTKSTVQEISEKGMYLQITAPHAVAGVVIFESKVRRTAPIFEYMYGWTRAYLYEHCAARGWAIKRVPDGDLRDPKEELRYANRS